MTGTRTSRAVATAAVLAAAMHTVFAQATMPVAASLEMVVPHAPQPVVIGGRVHLAYELHLTSFRAVEVRLAGVDVLADQNTPLATYRDEALADGLARAGARPDRSDKRRLTQGQRVIFFVWLGLDGPAAPTGLRHRVSIEVAGPDGPQAGVVEGGVVTVDARPAVTLSPPLRGGPWAAIYDPASIGGHRRALFAIGGRARIPARFAVDWIGLGEDGAASHGDPAVLTNWTGYGAEVLAVSDGRIAAVVDTLPEPTRPIAIDTAAGNLVVLELGDGRFAHYEHLQPKSVRVKVGDRVHRGQVLAALGASGSVSSGPHLHFHVADANDSLGAEGLPFVFDRFDVLGAFASIDAFARGERWTTGGAEAGVRTREHPRQQRVIRF